MKFRFQVRDSNPSLGVGVDRYDNHDGYQQSSTGHYYVGYLDLWRIGLGIEVFW